MRPQKDTVQDPLLQQAVLDLFRASEAYRAAYHDFERTGDARIIEQAAHRIDEARSRVNSVQADAPRSPPG